MTIAELQSRLRNSGTVVLELVTLPAEVIAFGLTQDGLIAARTPIAQTALADLGTRATHGDAEALARLFDVLVRPVSGAIAPARRLIVVADAALDAVPFGALYDSQSKRHLIERLPVALSPSALVLRSASPREPTRSLMTVSLPEGERGGSAALPQVREELDDVRGLYAHAIERTTFADVATGATQTDVLHIAGHTQVRTGSDEAMLGFAAAHGDAREWLSWRRIAGRRFLSGTTVVLAACETLRRPESPQTFALSLGGGFLAAGADDVIGTIAAIGDKDAHRIFYAIHRQLAAGADAAEAVRRAQIDALSSRLPNRTPWFAVSVLTDRIASQEQQEEP